MATKKETPSPEDLGLVPEQPALENPEETSNEAESTQPKKRRGRPPGSTNTKQGEAPKKSAAKKSEDIAGLARQIQGIHQLVALTTGLPELAISDVESLMLADGVTAVTEEYGFALNGKTGAAIKLFGAVAVIHGPRLLAIKARAEAARKAAQAEAENTIDVNMVARYDKSTPAH